MRKRVMMLGATLLLLNTMTIPAHSDVYVIVDSNNVVVSGAIVCDAHVCGDPNSLYSRLTLKTGERYVLQGRTDAQGNNSGIGAQPNQILVVKEEADKNTFVAATATTITTIVTPKVVESTPTPQPEPISTPAPVTTPTPTPQPTVTETTTVTTVDTSTVTIVTDSATVVVTPEPTPTETPVENNSNTGIDLYSWAIFFDWLREFFASLYLINL
jgi:hypothetical protein